MTDVGENKGLLNHDEHTAKNIEQNKSNKTRMWIIIIVVIVLLGAAGAIIGVVVSGSSDGSDDGPDYNAMSFTIDA